MSNYINGNLTIHFSNSPFIFTICNPFVHIFDRTHSARFPITTLGQPAQTCLTPLRCFLRNLLTKAATKLCAEPGGPLLSRTPALNDTHHEVATAMDVFLPKVDHIAVQLWSKQEVMIMALLIVTALAIIVADAGLPIAGPRPC